MTIKNTKQASTTRRPGQHNLTLLYLRLYKCACRSASELRWTSSSVGSKRSACFLICAHNRLRLAHRPWILPFQQPMTTHMSSDSARSRAVAVTCKPPAFHGRRRQSGITRGRAIQLAVSRIRKARAPCYKVMSSLVCLVLAHEQTHILPAPPLPSKRAHSNRTPSRVRAPGPCVPSQP